MHVLVTGGAGFIGSHFIRHILAANPRNRVTNLDALTYAGNLENLSDVEGDSRYAFVKGDICDRDTVFGLMKDVDAVVHFAAESHVDRSILDASAFIRTNILGTHTLLEAAKEYGIRFHHVSTDEVFGSLGPKDAPFHEGTPYDPRSPYAASKAGSDHLVRAYYHTYNLPITISNCTNNYGSHMFPEKIIPLFITNLLEGKKVPIYGDGGQSRDWINVADHNRGVALILEKGQIGETYCLGGGNELTNLDLAKKIISLLGQDETMIDFVKDRPGHDRRYAMNFSKAKKEMGFEPLIPFDDGLRATVEWYRSNPEWVARAKSGEYRAYYERQYGISG